jgi:hypothetical protein
VQRWYAFPEHDVVDELVALVHFIWAISGGVHLLRLPAEAPPMQNTRTFRWPCAFHLEDLQHIGVTRDAERREPGAMHVLTSARLLA